MWDEYRAFLAVLRSGGFAPATAPLDLVHATVRRRIQSLEHRLGEALFIHTSEGLTPTLTARRLTPFAASMEGIAEAFARAAASPPDSLAGVVRVSAPDIFALEILPPALAALRRTCPDIAIELSIPTTGDTTASRTSDIHILATPVGGLPDCRLLEWGLFAHSDFVRRRGAPREAGDLAWRALIGSRSLGGGDPLLAGLGLDPARIDFAFRVEGRGRQLAAVRAGVGVGLCPVAIAGREPALVRILPAFAVRQAFWILANPILSGMRRVAAVHEHLVRGVAALTEGPSP